MSRRNLSAWLNVAPLMLVLVPFFLLPILVVLAASFFETDGFGGLLPTFTFANYVDVLTSAQTFQLYMATLKFTVLTWFFTLMIGFLVAYFLVFHVRNQLLAIGLFLVCTVPFWTSNIIRMISWIPLLGKEGLVNSALLGTGIIREPIEVQLAHALVAREPLPALAHRAVRRLLAANRQRDRDALAGELRQHVFQCLPARRICPVHVLQHDHQRPRFARAAQIAHELFQQPVTMQRIE